jgi:hypothetical protein
MVPDVDNPSLEPNQRGKNLLALRGGNVDVFLADVTLEWDLARAQPREPLLTNTMSLVHPVSGPRVAAMTQLSPTAWATEFRSKLTEKAVFAQELAATLDADREQKLVIPGYLKRAIEHATTPPPQPPEEQAHPAAARR